MSEGFYAMEPAVYTVRPGGTSLRIEAALAHELGIQWGDHLTPEQFDCEDIQALIRNRNIAEKSKRK